MDVVLLHLSSCSHAIFDQNKHLLLLLRICFWFRFIIILSKLYFHNLLDIRSKRFSFSGSFKQLELNLYLDSMQLLGEC